MLTEVKKEIKLVFLSIKYNIMRQMINPLSFTLNVIFMMLNNAAFIIQWIILFSLKDSFGGYGFNEMMLIWGISSMVYGLSFIMFGGAFTLCQTIENGGLDQYLVTPRNLYYSVISSYSKVSAIGDFLYGLVLCLIFYPKSILLCLLFSIIGASIMKAFGVILNSLAFWITRSDDFADSLLGAFISFSLYPDTIFSKFIRVLMYTVLPVGFAVFLPVNIIMNFNIYYFIIVILFTIMINQISHLVFNKVNIGGFMKKEEYIKITNEILNGKSKDVMLSQIENYFLAKDNFKIDKPKYNISDKVKLKKGTLLHGTYENFNGLKLIVQNGLVSNFFTEKVRGTKYPSSVGVWNLKKDYDLNEYINFYSGGTIRYNNLYNKETKTEVIPYSNMKNINEIIEKSGFQKWYMEQTKEARFMPNLLSDNVQIGIIFDSDNKYIKKLLVNDILSGNMDNEVLKDFVVDKYYDRFLIDVKNKDDFFTDRESAVLFGIPSNFIEGILVGRTYENDEKMLKNIKELLPNVYICNLDGIVIK